MKEQNLPWVNQISFGFTSAYTIMDKKEEIILGGIIEFGFLR